MGVLLYSGTRDMETKGRYATQKEKACRGDSQVKEIRHEREICHTKREGMQGRFSGKRDRTRKGDVLHSRRKNWDTQGRYATQKEKACRGYSQVKEIGHEKETCYTPGEKTGTRRGDMPHKKRRHAGEILR
jgi:hypothetical protein